MADQVPQNPGEENPPVASSASAVSTAEVVNIRLPAKLPSRPRKIRKLSPDNSEASTKSNNKIVPRPRLVGVANQRSLSSEGEVEIAVKHLRAADPILAKVLDLHDPPSFDTFQTPFQALSKSILHQQLAYKAGNSIYARFVALCGGESGVLPETILAFTPQQLRQIGVSGRKTGYLHDLARKYRNGILSDSAIISMDDKSLYTMLTMVNGIGSWSVHMFMIFSLHRPDVLPTNDLGIRKGVHVLYDLEDLPRPSQLEQLCEKWRPYRSVASWYIWKFMEGHGVPSASAVVTAPAAMHLQPLPQSPLPPLPSLQQTSPLSSPQQQQQSQHQPQFIHPIDGIINLGLETHRCG